MVPDRSGQPVDGCRARRYAFSDELPIFLLIFLLLAAAAVIVNGKFF